MTYENFLALVKNRRSIRRSRHPSPTRFFICIWRRVTWACISVGVVRDGAVGSLFDKTASGNTCTHEDLRYDGSRLS